MGWNKNPNGAKVREETRREDGGMREDGKGENPSRGCNTCTLVLNPKGCCWYELLGFNL